MGGEQRSWLIMAPQNAGRGLAVQQGPPKMAEGALAAELEVVGSFFGTPPWGLKKRIS